jgi:hypothetical protein
MPASTTHPPDSTDEKRGSDFSLVVGGPLYQFFRRTRLSTEGMGLAHRRVIAVILIAWAPLMVLSALQGGLIGDGRGTPFIEDIGYQLRFLVVAPLLIIAEVIVHLRMRPIVGQFEIRGLVRPREAARFAAAIDGAARWRNSMLAEVALLAVVYAAGILFTLRRYLNMGVEGWWALPAGGLSLAGYWLVFVSLPLLQFLLLRWYFRLFIWARFLWRVSRLDLDLNATHPDKAGGLDFLGESLTAFVPIAAAQGVLLAGMMADRILFAGAKLTDFKVEVFGGALFLLLVFVGPLLVWIPKLARVKRAGLRTYGALGQTYVLGFREKWLSGAPQDEPLLGSGDIQSLADLGNSYSGAEQMRLAPIQPASVVAFLAAFLAPIAPLLLTMMSLEKLIGQVVGVVF